MTGRRKIAANRRISWRLDDFRAVGNQACIGGVRLAAPPPDHAVDFPGDVAFDPGCLGDAALAVRVMQASALRVESQPMVAAFHARAVVAELAFRQGRETMRTSSK